MARNQVAPEKKLSNLMDKSKTKFKPRNKNKVAFKPSTSGSDNFHIKSSKMFEKPDKGIHIESSKNGFLGEKNKTNKGAGKFFKKFGNKKSEEFDIESGNTSSPVKNNNTFGNPKKASGKFFTKPSKFEKNKSMFGKKNKDSDSKFKNTESDEYIESTNAIKTKDTSNFFVKPNGKKENPKSAGEVNSNKNSWKMKPFTKLKDSVDKEGISEQSKKPFDKKKYRLQKYSKKYKLDQWEDKRKKAVLREYYRSVEDDEPKLDVSKIYEQYKDDESEDENKISEENENNLNNSINRDREFPPSKSEEEEKQQKKKKKPFKKAQEEFQRIKEEKQKRKEEFLQKKAERDDAVKKLKKEKAEKYRKLSRRTRKGQPIMKDRMEMLLEKIQKMT